MLKTLSQAIQDGDSIECIVRETGVNQDGRTPGITMPSPRAQEILIRQTYEKAGLNPEVDGCQYFEAHGGWSLNVNLFFLFFYFFILLLSCAHCCVLSDVSTSNPELT